MRSQATIQLKSNTRQQGVALAIALILLVVMTLLGLSSVRTIGQQEKMTSHSVDRSLVYQYAEAALREGEAQAQIQALATNNGFPTDEDPANNACNNAVQNRCQNGLCAAPDPDCTARWVDPNFNGWQQYAGVPAILQPNGSALIGTLASGIPEYFVEILRPACGTPGGAADFDLLCNRKHPNPDNSDTCGACPAVPGSGSQCCYFYRYRVTARVQPPGRAAVIVQSIYSVEPQ